MENANRWYFTKDDLASTPSRKSGIDTNKELSYRQQAANFIQDMGQRLQVTQLCINTAIVYMHRFYVFHSFSEVHRNSLSVAALFLAAKVEEQPRKLEHVIKVAHVCLHKDSPPLDVRTEAFAEKQFEVVAHENVLLQTLGFVLAIEHPHTYVVKVCQLVKASKDLAQTSYFMATTSLHMTTMCLQYRPTVVACVCIHLACKWSSWKIEPCSEGKEWYYYVDKSVTLDLLETLTQEFIAILETSPHKFKRCTKFNAQKDTNIHGSKTSVEYNFKQHMAENKLSSLKKDVFSPGPSTSLNQVEEKYASSIKIESCEKVMPLSSSPKRNKIASHSISIDTYREKKEKERTLVEPKATLKEFEKVTKDLLEQPLKEKASKNSTADSQQSNKVLESPIFKKEIKSGFLKSDPVVVLERVDAKSDEVCVSPSQDLARGDSNATKSKHKINSIHNCYSSPQSISHKLSPTRDFGANGSNEADLEGKRNTDNNVEHKIEKREKHKSKHSSKSKSITNHSNPSIKVKIRKDIIILPEKSQKSTFTPENLKKSLKIKLPKPPATDPVSTPIKLVITKDKSGSGSYCTSHKNGRESKKRAHSPSSQDSNYKNHGDTKHARLEHTPNVKQSKPFSDGNESYNYLSANVETSAGHSYYNHYSCPPHRGKIDSNPPLPPFPPPLPPPPPE